MMRKFPKLLAVVLAIAIIICPAMCLTSMAEESTPANDYSVAYENNVVTVTVSANEGFLVALLRLDVTGFSVDEDAITVAATPLGLDDPGTVVANPDFNAETGVLSLLIASNEAANTALMTDATVSIPVTKTAEDDNYGISLTTLQAADAGTIDEETGVVTAPEALLTFTNVNTETGEIDVEAAAGKNVAVAPCAHADRTTTEQAATCTEDGFIKVTCNTCGKVISNEVIEATGHDNSGEYDYDENNHWFICATDDSHHIDEAPHAFDDENDADCVCGYTREIGGGEDVCLHENWSAWEITQPTRDATGLKVRTCLDCGVETEEVVIPAAQLDSTMVFRTPDVRIGETFGLRIRARQSVLSDATATYKVVVTPQKYNGTTLMEESGETVEYDFPLDGSNYTLELKNIAITELGLNVNAYIVRYDADGIFEAYGEVLAINPAQLLKGMINDTATEGTTAYKLNTMIADALNLGAAAQDYFPGLLNSTTCDLYTAARVNEGVDSKWASAELGDLTTVNTESNTVWNPSSTITADTNPHVVEVTINPAPTPVFVIRRATSTGSNPLNYADLTLTVTYTSSNDGKTRTETVTGADWNNCVSGKHLKYAFAKVAMYDADQTITATLTYQGTEVFTSTYTLETYVDTNKDSAQLGSIMTSIGKFGISARDYFKSLG